MDLVSCIGVYVCKVEKRYFYDFVEDKVRNNNTWNRKDFVIGTKEITKICRE